MLRVTADTTVFVSAIAKQGPGASKILLSYAEGEFVLITSEPILHEIRRSLEAEGADATEINRAERGLRNSAIIVTPTEAITACRDADDNKILEAAVAGNADCIVSDDKDLRVLSPFRGIEIVTVNRFLRRLGIRKTS